jgi:hypothetical protein
MSLDEFSISAMTSYITGLPNTLVLFEKKLFRKFAKAKSPTAGHSGKNFR